MHKNDRDLFISINDSKALEQKTDKKNQTLVGNLTISKLLTRESSFIFAFQCVARSAVKMKISIRTSVRELLKRRHYMHMALIILINWKIFHVNG